MSRVFLVLYVLKSLFYLINTSNAPEYVPKSKAFKHSILSPIPPYQRKKIRFIDEAPSCAKIEKVDQLSWEILEETPECTLYAILNETEVDIVKDLNRLGVRIYYSLSGPTINLKYQKSIRTFDNCEDEEPEIHPLFNCLDTMSPISGSIWDIINTENQNILIQTLTSALEATNLFQVHLILSKHPDLIEQIPERIFKNIILINRNNLKSTLKYLFIRKDPELFMKKMMKICKSEPEMKYHSTLIEVLNDSKVSDKTIQLAFNSLLGDSESDPNDLDLDLLKMFIQSARTKISISESKLHSIIFDGRNDLSTRVSLLTLNIPSNFITTTLTKTFQDGTVLIPILQEILSYESILNKLNPEFIVHVLSIILHQNDSNVIAKIFTKNVKTFIFNHKLQRNILFNVLKFINVENFNYLINLKTISHINFPVFSRKDMIEAAAYSIKESRNDLCAHLFSKNYITAKDKSSSTGKSLLAIGVEVGNVDFLRMASFYGIDLNQCSDALSLAEGNELITDLLLKS